MELNEKIRAYIKANLLVSEKSGTFADSDDIFKLGFVNSLFAMKLITFVESEFNIVVEDDEIDTANFNSVNTIVAFINKKWNKQ